MEDTRKESEWFYIVWYEDYSNFDSTMEFDKREDAITFAENQWENGEGGNLNVRVDKTWTSPDGAHEEMITIWSRSAECKEDNFDYDEKTCERTNKYDLK